MFKSAVLERASFENAVLTGCQFPNAVLRSANFRSAQLDQAGFGRADLEDADFRGSLDTASAPFTGAILCGVNMNGLDLTGARFDGAQLCRADLANAKLNGALMVGADLTEASLEGASFADAALTNVVWRGARIGRGSGLETAVWNSAHRPTRDGSEDLDLSVLQRWVSWDRIRFLSRVPLFSGAYLILLATLATVSLVEWLNTYEFVTFIQYPIPLPPRASVLLLGSALLAVSTTIFEFVCPPRVKEFSRTKWVEELGQPRMIHIAEALKAPVAAATTQVCLGIGGVFVGYVFLERLVMALLYVVGTVT